MKLKTGNNALKARFRYFASMTAAALKRNMVSFQHPLLEKKTKSRFALNRKQICNLIMLHIDIIHLTCKEQK